MVEWYSVFSHTGSETANIYEMELPDVRFMQAYTNATNWDSRLPRSKVSSINSKYDIEAVLRNLSAHSLVTLNGYNRILSRATLETLGSRDVKIFNIHPAPIHLYPELRGLDPQERLYEGNYPLIGVVIHEVVPEVDSGRIVHWKTEFADPGMSKSQLYAHLHSMGTEAWRDFFEEKMYDD